MWIKLPSLLNFSVVGGKIGKLREAEVQDGWKQSLLPSFFWNSKRKGSTDYNRPLVTVYLSRNSGRSV